MPAASLGLQHLLSLHFAADVYDMFRLLGYDVDDQSPFEDDDLEHFEFDEADMQAVRRVYIVGRRDNHTVYLFEVNDLRHPRLRGLAWNVLERGGTALLVLTKDYREIIFVDPRLVGTANKSNVRVNKLKMVVSDPTCHDLDTLNAIHAHRRTGQQIYEAQAEAFNVNTVTKHFYDEYHLYYDKLRAAAKQYNRGIREFQDEDQADKLHAFAQRLLGRLMFIYFLQRKGWMGGRQKFLTEQFRETARRHLDKFTGDGETFYYYEEVLAPLFFETMNTRRIGNATRWPGISIPYLNGGLFDPARDPQGMILLPDSLFDPNSNEGILAFFNRYNFTVSEDTPLEQDVAVDPEMLGKVFENLLEERDRGQSGSFYTPRVIVAYMCREAVAGYLEESANVSRDLVRAQFDPDSKQRFSEDDAKLVNAVLDTLTVLDPAVGSGSFLIGMLQEIIRLRRACAAVLNVEVTPALLADWKEAIIRDTLYGVDIKPEAIEVAQLRLWLALVVDQALDQARPLPNLDYKLMAGNSLIETIDGEPVLGPYADAMLDGNFDYAGPAVVPVQLNLMGQPVQTQLPLTDSAQTVQRERAKLDNLYRRFFRADPEERRQLRAEIVSQERQIVYASLRDKSDRLMEQIGALGQKAGQKGLSKTEKSTLEKRTVQFARIEDLEKQVSKVEKPLPFFLYRMHFHEVFTKKGGFDIVIANPPYVQMELIKEQKAEFEATYPDVYAGRADLYVYFFVRGIRLLRTGGQLAYISSNKWLRTNYGAKLRSYLSEHLNILYMIDFGELPVFEGASTFPMVLLAEKNNDGAITHYVQVGSLDAPYPDMGAVVREYGKKLPLGAVHGNGWSLSVGSSMAILQKLKENGISLSDYVNGEIYYGIKSGLNTAFVIHEATYTDLIAQDNANANLLKPFVFGRNVSKWLPLSSSQYLIFTYHGVPIDRYPTLIDYLEQFKNQLQARATIAQHAWYELQQAQIGTYGFFERPKIIYPDISRSAKFALDSTGAYLDTTVFMIPTEDLYLLGILNSVVVWRYLCETIAVLGDASRGGRLRLKRTYMAGIPIPITEQHRRDQIAAIVHQCLNTPDEAKLAPLEARLNQLVYEAYGLDENDIRVIEGHLSRQPTPVVESDGMKGDEGED